MKNLIYLLLKEKSETNIALLEMLKYRYFLYGALLLGITIISGPSYAENWSLIPTKNGTHVRKGWTTSSTGGCDFTFTTCTPQKHIKHPYTYKSYLDMNSIKVTSQSDFNQQFRKKYQNGEIILTVQFKIKNEYKPLVKTYESSFNTSIGTYNRYCTIVLKKSKGWSDSFAESAMAQNNITGVTNELFYLKNGNYIPNLQKML